MLCSLTEVQEAAHYLQVRQQDRQQAVTAEWSAVAELPSENRKMKNKILIAVAGLVLIGILFFVFRSSDDGKFVNLKSFNQEMTLYKSLSCGCCGVYAGYFKSKGNSDVEIIDTSDITSIKQKYGVPRELESCHTTIIGDYFVEGHIPLEAVEKLIEEQPDIAGIAMPGMPYGSPGMLGQKSEYFIIYAVNHDGSYEEFMRI